VNTDPVRQPPPPRSSVVRGAFEGADSELVFTGGLARTLRVGPVMWREVSHEPGWRWSRDVGGRQGADVCMATHCGFMTRGQMMVRGADGRQIELAKGDVFAISPGHDAWTVGETTCAFVEVLLVDEGW
jgi:hypothetical protein